MDPRHRRLLDVLDARDVFFARWMRDAFLAVPRGLFVPDTVYRLADDKRVHEPVSRLDAPEEWGELAWGADLVVTQIDGGDPTVGENLPTSSLSAPGAVTEMLRYLDLQPGHRVLEIGTGPGFNAAVLAHRAGRGGDGTPLVTSVEVDPAVHRLGAANLARTGAAVTAVLGDGEDGYPPGAPYDRVIATASVRSVPYAWVAQTRPGGRIVVPFRTAFYPHGLVELDVRPDGTASGRFRKPVSFMSVRGQQDPPPAFDRAAPPDWRENTTPTRLGWQLPSLARDAAALHPVGLLVPDVSMAASSNGAVWWIHDAAGSWAYADDAADQVWQGGPRRLWDEVDAVLDWLDREGNPPIGMWGLTVTAEGQHPWYGTADRPAPHTGASAEAAQPAKRT